MKVVVYAKRGYQVLKNYIIYYLLNILINDYLVSILSSQIVVIIFIIACCIFSLSFLPFVQFFHLPIQQRKKREIIPFNFYLLLSPSLPFSFLLYSFSIHNRQKAVSSSIFRGFVLQFETFLPIISLISGQLNVSRHFSAYTTHIFHVLIGGGSVLRFLVFCCAILYGDVSVRRKEGRQVGNATQNF